MLVPPMLLPKELTPHNSKLTRLIKIVRVLTGRPTQNYSTRDSPNRHGVVQAIA